MSVSVLEVAVVVVRCIGLKVEGSIVGVEIVC